MCLKQKKKKNLYFIQPDLIVSIFYSFYQIRSFIHSHSHSLSFISHSSQAPLSQCCHRRQAHSGTVQLASSFFSFFFFILSNPVSFTLSRSPSSLISSLSSSLSQRRRPDHRIRRCHRQVQTHAANLPQTHFSSADPLQVSCLCLLHVMLWVFDLGITSSSADPPIHFGFLIWIHFMWMSLFFIFDCCSGLLAW